MLLIQMTGMSGAGKSTIAQATQEALRALGYAIELIDGDVYRQRLCKDLGFSKADRLENIRRLGAHWHIVFLNTHKPQIKERYCPKDSFLIRL